MSIFDKLFGKNKASENEDRAGDERSKFMPDDKLPLDEQFIHHFTKQGGRLLYSLNEEEIQAHFEDIMVEHDFFEQPAFCYDKQLIERFSNFNLDFNASQEESSLFLTTCEYLISDHGAILFSSNQIKEKKPAQLPDTFIVIASTSQIVETIGEGLRGIKHNSGSSIPTNITTLKNFQERTEGQDKDLMQYGAPHKRCYLILVEDL
ncbi:MAG: lactate utilization protein [Nonlabens sp.]|nr:lactate utilization protein [Nonlabens sp.]